MKRPTTTRHRRLAMALLATGTIMATVLVYEGTSVAAGATDPTSPSASTSTTDAPATSAGAPSQTGTMPATAPPSLSPTRPPGGTDHDAPQTSDTTTPTPVNIDFSNASASDWSAPSGITVSIASDSSGNRFVQFDGITRYGEIGRYTIRNAAVRKGYQYWLHGAVGIPAGQPETGFTLSRSGYPGRPEYATATRWAGVGTQFIATGIAEIDGAIEVILAVAHRCYYDTPVPTTTAYFDNLVIQQLGLVPATTADPVPTTGTTPTWQCTIPPSPPPADGIVASWDFEDGTTQGWTGMLDERVTVTSTAHTGQHALLVSGVTAGGGAEVYQDVTTNPGGHYRITGHVIRTDPGPPALIALTDWPEEASYVPFGTGSWTEVTGYADEFGSIPIGEIHVSPRRFLVAPVNPGDTLPPVSFAVDDVTVTWIGEPTPTPTTTATSPAAICRAEYRVMGRWPGGFLAIVRVSNAGRTINGWTMGWTFPGDQRINQLWGGDWQQTNKAVTVVSLPYNTLVPTGGTVRIGFIATGSSTDVVPTSVTLNGVACPVG